MTFRNPTAATAVLGVWTTASNALTRNGAFATSASDPARLALTNYGFAIPGTSTIRRIGVNVFCRNASGNEADREVEVFLTLDGTNQAPGSQSLTQVADTALHGFLFEQDEGRWNVSLTPGNVNAVTFGVLVGKKNAGASTLEIDSAEVVVEYSEANLYDGRGGTRIFVAQFGQTGYIADGVAPLLKDRGGSNDPFHYGGLDAPTQAPTVAAGGAGLMSGTKYVYVTFFNTADRIRSNPSPVSASVVLSNQQLVVSNIETHRDLRETQSADIRREVWVTLAGSAEAFRAAEINDNTTTSVTIDISDADGEVLEFLERTRNGRPPLHRYLAVLKERLVMAGEPDYSFTADVTNGSRRVQATFTGGTADTLQRLNPDMVGKWVSVDSEHGRYVIQSIDGPESLTLESAYGGATGAAVTMRMFSRMATAVAWSQAGSPESFLATDSKQFAVQDADRITAIFPHEGRILVFMDRHIGAFSWHINPAEDGVLQALVVGRGALESCVVMAEGAIYAMDTMGVYRYSGSGSAVEEIDGPVRPILEGRSGEPFLVNWSNRANFWGLADERHGMVHWFLSFTGVGGSIPVSSLSYDYVHESWMVGRWDHSMISGAQVLLTDGRIAPLVAATASVSYFWEFWGGAADGVVQSGLAMTGTVTSAGATTMTDSGAAWPTTDNGLAGLMVRTRSPGGTWGANRPIISNTATVITTNPGLSPTPSVGDEYAFGRIDAYWQSGWLDFGAPGVRKRIHEARVQMLPMTGATALLRFLTDWSSTGQASERRLTDEEGVDVTQGETDYTIDPNQADWAQGQARIRLGAMTCRLLSVRADLSGAGTRPVLDEISLTAEVFDEVEGT